MNAKNIRTRTWDGLSDEVYYKCSTEILDKVNISFNRPWIGAIFSRTGQVVNNVHHEIKCQKNAYTRSK